MHTAANRDLFLSSSSSFDNQEGIADNVQTSYSAAELISPPEVIILLFILLLSNPCLLLFQEVDFFPTIAPNGNPSAEGKTNIKKIKIKINK